MSAGDATSRFALSAVDEDNSGGTTSGGLTPSSSGGAKPRGWRHRRTGSAVAAHPESPSAAAGTARSETAPPTAPTTTTRTEGIGEPTAASMSTGSLFPSGSSGEHEQGGGEARKRRSSGSSWRFGIFGSAKGGQSGDESSSTPNLRSPIAQTALGRSKTSETGASPAKPPRASTLQTPRRGHTRSASSTGHEHSPHIALSTSAGSGSRAKSPQTKVAEQQANERRVQPTTSDDDTGSEFGDDVLSSSLPSSNAPARVIPQMRTPSTRDRSHSIDIGFSPPTTANDSALNSSPGTTPSSSRASTPPNTRKMDVVVVPENSKSAEKAQHKGLRDKLSLGAALPGRRRSHSLKTEDDPKSPSENSPSSIASKPSLGFGFRSSKKKKRVAEEEQWRKQAEEEKAARHRKKEERRAVEQKMDEDFARLNSFPSPTVSAPAVVIESSDWWADITTELDSEGGFSEAPSAESVKGDTCAPLASPGERSSSVEPTKAAPSLADQGQDWWAQMTAELEGQAEEPTPKAVLSPPAPPPRIEVVRGPAAGDASAGDWWGNLVSELDASNEQEDVVPNRVEPESAEPGDWWGSMVAELNSETVGTDAMAAPSDFTEPSPPKESKLKFSALIDLFVPPTKEEPPFRVFSTIDARERSHSIGSTENRIESDASSVASSVVTNRAVMDGLSIDLSDLHQAMSTLSEMSDSDHTITTDTDVQPDEDSTGRTSAQSSIDTRIPDWLDNLSKDEQIALLLRRVEQLERAQAQQGDPDAGLERGRSPLPGNASRGTRENSASSARSSSALSDCVTPPVMSRDNSMSRDSSLDIWSTKSSHSRRFALSEESSTSSRLDVIREIIQTERLYVDNLNLVISQFMPTLRESGVSETDLERLFHNVAKLYRGHSNFLRRMEGRLHSVTEQAGCVSDIFTRDSAFFSEYRTYVSTIDSGLELLAQLRANTNSKAASALISLENDRTRNPRLHTLSTLLAEPVQRLPRYDLLLADLADVTRSNHPSLADLTSALSRVRLLMKRCDHDRRNRVQLIRIQKLIEAKAFVSFQLETRHFYRDGIMIVSKEVMSLVGESSDESSVSDASASSTSSISSRTSRGRSRGGTGQFRRSLFDRLSGTDSSQKRTRHMFLFRDLLLLCKIDSGTRRSSSLSRKESADLVELGSTTKRMSVKLAVTLDSNTLLDQGSDGLWRLCASKGRSQAICILFCAENGQVENAAWARAVQDCLAKMALAKYRLKG